MTGVPSSKIYRILKNKDGNPTIEVLKKLSGFFQITVSQLIGEEPIGCKQTPIIPPNLVLNYMSLKIEGKSKFQTIAVDFPLNPKSFATYSQDNMKEPFILINSIIIVDPEKEVSNKDFVLIIKNENDISKIRQVVQDGSDFYLKVLNPSYQIPLTRTLKEDYQFIGVIVHYRTNLFNLSKSENIEHNIQDMVI